MIRLFILAGLAGGGALLTAGPAGAQSYANLYNNFYRGYSFGNRGAGFVPGLYVNNPYTGQSFSYNYTSRFFLGADYVNPITGNRNYFYLNRTITGPVLPGAAFRSLYNPYLAASATPAAYYGGYLGGGVGALGMAANNPANNPIVQEQVRLLKAAGGQPNDNDIEARKLIADQWAYEQRAKAANAPANAAGVAFRDTPEEEVLSGRGIDEIAAAVRDLEKTKSASAPLLPGDLLSRVVYDRSPAADVIEMAKAGRLDFPEALAGRDWLALRTDLEKAAAPVLEPLAAGKPIPPAASDALAAQVRASRAEAAPLIRSVEFATATEVSRFFNRLDQLAQVGKVADLKAAYVPAWDTVGASAKEFADHLGKHGLSLAHAQPGDEEAYFSLHRALADYYNALAAK